MGLSTVETSMAINNRSWSCWFVKEKSETFHYEFILENACSLPEVISRVFLMFIVKQFVSHVIKWNSSRDPVQELIIEVEFIGYVMFNIVIISVIDTCVSCVIFSLFMLFGSKASNGLVTNDSLIQ